MFQLWFARGQSARWFFAFFSFFFSFFGMGALLTVLQVVELMTPSHVPGNVQDEPVEPLRKVSVGATG